MAEDTEYFDTEDFKEILRQYEESVKSGESIYMDADDLADIADFYHFHNRIAEANEAISLALKFNPEAIGPMLYKAREALEANDFVTAEAYANKVEASDTLESVYLRAEILIKKGDVDDANHLLSEYFQDVPDDERIDFAKGVINLYLDYDQFSKAFEWSVHIPKQSDPIYKEMMARTLVGLGRYKDSEKLFNELLDFDPYSTTYWNALAGVQYMKEDYSAALTSSEYAIAINPNDTNSLMAKANTLYAMGNLDEALSYFRKYSEMVPDDEYSYLHQALILINKEQHQEAVTLLEKAASVATPDSIYLVEIYQELAFTYNTLGDLDKAISSLDKTKQLNCDHIYMEITKGHLLLANDKKEEAIKTFTLALQASNNDPHTRLRIIISYHDNKYLQGAYEAYTKFFMTVEEGFDEGYSYMALCCHDLAKYDEFLYYLKKACDINPEEAKTVLGVLFPEGMNPQDYYAFAIEHLND